MIPLTDIQQIRLAGCCTEESVSAVQEFVVSLAHIQHHLAIAYRDVTYSRGINEFILDTMTRSNTQEEKDSRRKQLKRQAESDMAEMTDMSTLSN